MGVAFWYTERYPLETEANYPYVAKSGKCSYDKSKGAVKSTTYANVKARSPADLKAAIAKGPVSIGI